MTRAKPQIEPAVKYVKLERAVEKKKKQPTVIEKDQTPQDTMQKDYGTKVITHYRDSFTFYNYPVTEKTLVKLAQEYVEWAREDQDAFRCDQFFHLKGIPPKTMYVWMKEHSFLQDAHDAAMSLIAIRRETGVCKRDNKTGNTKYTRDALIQMHLYDDDWKKGMEWKASLSKTEETTSDIKIVMEAFPESLLVPPKKKDADESRLLEKGNDESK